MRRGYGNASSAKKLEHRVMMTGVYTSPQTLEFEDTLGMTMKNPKSKVMNGYN